MKSLIVFTAIMISIYLSACTTSHDEMSAEIVKMESALKASPNIDTIASAELLSAYQNFSARYPHDSLSPEYLYKAAGLAVGLNRGLQAVIIYDSVNQNYPGYTRNAECLFMEAFTYENTLGNIGKAKELYSEFLARYPNHELADDARTAIKFLGKSSEEIVSEFDKMSADSIK